MKPKSKLSRGEFAYTETSSTEANQRLLTSTNSLYDRNRELDDEPTEEDAFSCTSLSLEWMNNCVPHRNFCLACYDAVRSIPPISMVSIAIAATGYGVSVTNTTLLLSNMLLIACAKLDDALVSDECRPQGNRDGSCYYFI